MRLFIAEKPSVAKAIIREIGATKKTKSYVECKGGVTVTWCFGHLLEQAEPDDYLPEDLPKSSKGKKIWRMQDLPIFPKTWKLRPKTDKGVKIQLKVIKTLLGKADTVVNCGDPDREGQLLVDELLEYYKYQKPVFRFWVSAQDPESIRKGLSNLRSNKQYQGMKLAALGRSRADWLIGMNLTRALTLSNSKPGERTLIAVGRVQTPTLALVAARDNLIRNFKPKPFFSFKATLSTGHEQFEAKWCAGDEQKGLDESNRLVDPEEVKRLALKLKNAKLASVVDFSAVKKKTPPPKVYSLADIQLEASNKYGLSAEETLNTCQSLYEKHKVASYPRTDCQYLPLSQFQDAHKVLNAILRTDAKLSAFIQKADTRLKSSVWDDKKITAHHGIIPTSFAADIETFSENEKRIYDLICRRYIAQFYPAFEYLENKATITCVGEKFTARGVVVINKGWKLLYNGARDDSEEGEDSSSQSVPVLEKDKSVNIERISLVKDLTKAPGAFTEGTLVAAMEKIHTIVDNPEFKKYLKDNDGIGTPATRAAIISELKRKNYLVVKGKKIHVTELGQKLLSLVPVTIKNPILTAVFERKLKEVEEGKASLSDFLASQQAFVKEQIDKQKALAHEYQR